MGLDKYLLSPVFDTYNFITPDVMETNVNDFLVI
ncbi:hypothetical protein [Methylomonas sp. LL1]|nr:hypothetical protein [Methylomonas sp. LL1]